MNLCHYENPSNEPVEKVPGIYFQGRNGIPTIPCCQDNFFPPGVDIDRNVRPEFSVPQQPIPIQNKKQVGPPFKRDGLDHDEYRGLRYNRHQAQNEWLQTKEYIPPPKNGLTQNCDSYAAKPNSNGKNRNGNGTMNTNSGNQFPAYITCPNQRFQQNGKSNGANSKQKYLANLPETMSNRKSQQIGPPPCIPCHNNQCLKMESTNGKYYAPQPQDTDDDETTYVYHWYVPIFDRPQLADTNQVSQSEKDQNSEVGPCNGCAKYCDFNIPDPMEIRNLEACNKK